MGLACNETIVDVALDISCNNLGSQGAHVLESCVHGVRSISTLDITENSKHKNTFATQGNGTQLKLNMRIFFSQSDMDVELAPVITAVSKNKSVKHFHMGRNIVNMRAKHISSIMEALVHMIQVYDSYLREIRRRMTFYRDFDL